MFTSIVQFNPMKPKIDSWRNNKAIDDHFRNYLELDRFREAIVGIRKKAKLPIDGIEISKFNGNYFFDWRTDAGLSKGAVILVENGVEDMMARFALGQHLSEKLLTYIVFGEYLPEELFDFNSVPKTIGCELDGDGQSMIVRIYPEAKLSRVLKFVEEKWSDIELWQMHAAMERERRAADLNGVYWPDIELEQASTTLGPFQPLVKAKSKRGRDEIIMKLYEQKVVKASGGINSKFAQVILEKDGIKVEGIDEIENALRKKYDLPKSEAMKKIIQRQRKKQK